MERYDPIHPDNPPCPDIPDDARTTNFKLHLWTKEKITSWLTQLNYNFQKIDKIMWNFFLRTSINGEVPPEAIANIERLNDEVADIKAQLEVIKPDLETAKENITSLQTQTATNTTDISTLKINYTNLDTRMSTAEAAIQGINTTIEKIQNNMIQLEARVSALEQNSN